MIIELIFNPIFSLMNLILSPLEFINWAITVINVDILTEFFSVIAYVIPWQYITPLIIVIFSLLGFRIAISLIRLIKGFIPTMGGF